MRGPGILWVVLISSLLAAPALAEVSHPASQIRGGILGSDFGQQNFSINGTLDLYDGSIALNGQVGSHVAGDGTFYRTGGQVYLGADDNFYIRDSGNGDVLHLDTDSGALAINTTTAAAALEVNGGFMFTGQSVTIDTFSSDGTLGGGSADNATVPTQWAIKRYVDDQVGGTAGDVDGPASSTDNAIVRFDGTGGKTIQNSGVILTDSDHVVIPGRVQIGNTAITWYDDDPWAGYSNGFVSNDGALFVPVNDGASNSDLRLVITDDSADSFSIWGDTCGGGTCSELNASTLVAHFSAGGGVGIGTSSISGRLQVTGDEVRIGDAGTPGVASADGDLFVEDALEVDGSFDLGGTSVTGVSTATDLGGAGSSNNALPTQLAVKTYVDDQVGGTAGDVDGPASSTDNAIARFNGTGGKTIQNSGITIDDSDNIAGVTDLSASGLVTIEGTSASEGSVLVDNYEIKFLNSGQRHWSIFNNETSGNFFISDTSSSASTGTLGTNRLAIDGTGDVGIGTGNSGISGRLQVVGDEVRIGNAGTPGVASADGDLFVEDALEVDGSFDLGGTAVTGLSTATDLGGGSASDANLPTQLAVKTYVDNQVSGSGSMSNFTFAGDSGSTVIGNGDTATVAGGSSINTTESAGTVTVDVSDDSIDGTELADTITTDGNLNVDPGSSDVNFDSNTLVIDGSTDRVGIGVADPTTSLEIGDYSADEELRISGRDGSATGAVITWAENESRWVKAAYDSGNNLLKFDSNDVSNILVLNRGDGHVGIGTASPGEELDVNGTLILQTGTAINEFSTDGTLAGNSDSAVPTEQAVKTYVDNQVSGSGSMSNFTFAGDSGSTVISNGDTATVAGGSSINTTESAGTVTIDVTDDSIDGTELADTLTLDAALAVDGQDVNFDSNTLYVDSSGDQVGIGTTPSELLHIVGTSGQTDGLFIQDPTAATYGARFMFNDSSSQIILGTRSNGVDIDAISIGRDSGDISLQNGVSINEFSSDGTLAGNSNSAVPTEQAVKTYVDSAVGNSMTGFTVAGDTGSSDINSSDTLTVTGGSTIDTSVASDTLTLGVTNDSIGGAQLADAITLDAQLNISGQDVDFDSNTLFIDVSTDRVSVGNAAPGYALDVSGNAQIEGTGSGGYIYGDTATPFLRLSNAAGSFLAYGSNTDIEVDSNVIRFRTSGTEQASIDSAGKVTTKDIQTSGMINQTKTGVVQAFSNGCTMTANSSGLYWNC